MTGVFENVEQTVARVRERTSLAPRVGVVLGSGLGAFARGLERAVAIPYSELPHFPVGRVIGHAGELVLGHAAGVPLAVMSGRFHYYQCGDAAAAAFPMRVLAGLGVRTVLMTNAAGGIRPRLRPGALALIRDHINLIPNPLIGPNDDRLGPRFPDMTDAYSPRLRAAARAAAARVGVELEEGVYVAVPGPSYETPAEIRAFAALGADMVGMSTAPEVVVARHAGVEVLGLSVITNAAAGVGGEAIHHQEVLDTGAAVREKLTALLFELLPALASEETHGS